MTQPPHERLSRPSQRRTDASNRPSSAVTCNGCDNWWGGLTAAHCAACHRTFTSVAAFDLHRRNGKCLDPATVTTKNDEPKLVRAEKPWPGDIWSKPGTWRGPQ